jgi:hypothetical protein
MLSLDAIRLESARLQAELTHLSPDEFPAVHATITARLVALKQGEEAWERSAAAQRASCKPDPVWEQQKLQERITALRSGIPPLQVELTRVPVWDTARREQIEAAIANYEKQVEELEAQVV